MAKASFRAGIGSSFEVVHPERGVVTGQQRAGHPAEQPAEAERRDHGGARARVVIVHQAGQQRHEQREQQAADQAAAGAGRPVVGNRAAQDRAAHLDQDASHVSPSAPPVRAPTMSTNASSRRADRPGAPPATRSPWASWIVRPHWRPAPGTGCSPRRSGSMQRVAGARTLVLAGGPERARGEDELAAMSAAPMAPG